MEVTQPAWCVAALLGNRALPFPPRVPQTALWPGGCDFRACRPPGATARPASEATGTGSSACLHGRGCVCDRGPQRANRVLRSAGGSSPRGAPGNLRTPPVGPIIAARCELFRRWDELQARRTSDPVPPVWPRMESGLLSLNSPVPLRQPGPGPHPGQVSLDSLPPPRPGPTVMEGSAGGLMAPMLLLQFAPGTQAVGGR